MSLPPESENKLKQQVAVALTTSKNADLAKITAAGRGRIAQEIIELAFAHGIKVREDADLATLLAAMELDTPIPTEAIVAVAEILSKIYELSNAAPYGEFADTPNLATLPPTTT